MKIKYNGEFKFIDSEIKAYFLGLMYADGCIHTSKLKVCVSTITLKNDDLYLLEELQKEFPFFKITNCKDKYSRMYAYSKDLYNDLSLHGLYPRKSGENKDLLHIPNLDSKLMPHFIRGLYDGDGGYYKVKNLVETFVCSTSKAFILEIQKYFEDHDIKLHLSTKDLVNKGYQPIYYLRSKNRHTTFKFRDLIYGNYTIAMKRKEAVIISYNPEPENVIRSKAQLALNRKMTPEQLAKNKLINLGRITSQEIKDKQSQALINFHKNRKETTVPIKPSKCCDYHSTKCETVTTKKGLGIRWKCLKCNKKYTEY